MGYILLPTCLIAKLSLISPGKEHALKEQSTSLACLREEHLYYSQMQKNSVEAKSSTCTFTESFILYYNPCLYGNQE